MAGGAGWGVGVSMSGLRHNGLAGGTGAFPFYEQLAGDEVEDHGDEGRDDLGEHAVPGELVNHYEEQDFGEAEGDEVEDDEFHEETAAGFLAGGVENPGHTGEVAVGGGGGEGEDVGDEGVDVEELVQDEIKNPVNGGIDDADDDELGELLEDGGVGFKMEQATAPEDKAVNPVGAGRGGVSS